MIGNVNQLGKGFKGVASYLESGKDGQQWDRVEWVESRNLPTRDPQTAARIMSATAHDSERTAAPVYHFSISFDPGDPVDRESMRRVADRTLRDLGLQDHQALIVAHGDTAHPHVHVVVNRVHPERARAWSNFRDFPRIERSLRAQEVEMGLRVVPGKHARVPELDGAAQVRGPVSRAGHGDAEFLRDVQERAAPVLQRARTWAEVEQGLAQHGLAVRVNGRGMSVTDGLQQVKASEVDRAFSRARLEQRFGPWHSHRARVAVAEMPTPAAQRAPAAPERPRVDSGQNRPARPTVRTPAQQYREAARGLRADLRAIYADPDAARRALLTAMERRGPEAAAAIRTNPERYGAILPGVTAERRAQATHNAVQYATGRAGADRVSRAELRGMAAPIIEAHRTQHADAAVHNGVTAYARANTRRATMEGERTSIRQAVPSVREGAAEVYVRPDAALRAIRAEVRAHGPAEAARAVRTEPWRFGQLRGVERSRYMGLVTETSYRDATARAPELAARVEALARRMEVRPRAGDLARAQAEVLNARRGLDAANAAREALGRGMDAPERVREAAARIAGAMRRLGPESAAKLVQRLVPMVPTSAAQLVKSAVELGKLMMFGRDPERERGRER
ncbi:MAG TPA: relaxase/mobilization nuclease domain-containing protein [Longimicrobium sp.]